MIELLAANKTETAFFEKSSTIDKEPERQAGFLDMIIRINGSIENTLNYIESKIIEARFPHNNTAECPNLPICHLSLYRDHTIHLAFGLF